MNETPFVHGMIDLETLGLNVASAPVMQIGIATYLTRVPGVISSWSCRVTLESNEQLGRKVEDSTREWWEKPERAELWAKMQENKDAVPLYDALMSLKMFILQHKVQEVWSNGPAFDIAMLECAYRSLNEEAPWSHRNVRDTRTIWALAGDKHPPFVTNDKQVSDKLGWKIEQKDFVEAHDALSDCLWQILKVQTAQAILDMDSISLKSLSI